MPSTPPKDPLDLRAALRFLRGIERNNDRAWFHAHKDEWEPIRHGWEDLVTLLVLGGAGFDERLLGVDPRRCLFRLANDTRFHKDRAPYKTHLAAWISPGGKDGAYPGYYCHLRPGAVHFSAGIYVPDKAALTALRTTFAQNGEAARAFDRILGAKTMKAYLPLETDALRVTPRGFAKDHPRIALIRARNYLVSRDPPDAEVASAGALAWFARAMEDVAPFVRWIDERVQNAERFAGSPYLVSRSR